MTASSTTVVEPSVEVVDLPSLEDEVPCGVPACEHAAVWRGRLALCACAHLACDEHRRAADLRAPACSFMGCTYCGLNFQPPRVTWVRL